MQKQLLRVGNECRSSWLDDCIYLAVCAQRCLLNMLDLTQPCADSVSEVMKTCCTHCFYKKPIWFCFCTRQYGFKALLVVALCFLEHAL